MIRQIDIENFALFKSSRIRFHDGLNVLTGESGSGKSLALESLAALFGGRLSQERIGPWGDQVRLRAHVELDPADSRWQPFMDLGVEPDAILIVERTTGRDGRSGYRVQGQPIPAQAVRGLGDSLIQYVGQNQLLKILNRQYMLDWLDHYAGLDDLVTRARSAYQAYKAAERNVEDVRRLGRDLPQLEEKRQIRDELTGLAIEPGEDERLSQDLTRLRAGRTLIETGQALYAAIDGGEGPGVLAGLDDALRLAETLERYDPDVGNIAQAVRGAVEAISDARMEVSSWLGRLDLDPARLEQLEVRADLLSRAKRRYGPTLEDVLSFLDDLTEDIRRLENLDWELTRLEDKARRAWDSLSEAAVDLSSARQEALFAAQQELTERIREMEMPTGVIEIVRREAEMSVSGMDDLDVLFSASQGQDLKPLAKVASGGEIARVALSLAVTGPAACGLVYMFDEVDQGLGGASAERVARLLWQLGRSAQVLAVSHQAVVASRADHHLAVRKAVVSEQSVSTAVPLAAEQRVLEVARMLSGSDDDAAVHHATILLAERQDHS